MAKISGLIKIEGTLMGINFYKRKGKIIAREAGGGFNGEAIRTKKSMQRVRENGSEFGDCLRSVALFKKGLYPFLHLFKEGTLHQRLVQKFTQLKVIDSVSARGSRNIGTALKSEIGQQTLNGYVLTNGSNFQNLLGQNYSFEWSGSGLQLSTFSSSLVRFPEGSTHLELLVGYLTVDFEEGTTEFTSSTSFYFDKSYSGPLQIGSTTLPNGTGNKVGIVYGRFTQEVNGIYYPMLQNQMQVMEVVYVGL